MNYFFKNVKISRNKLTTFNASISLRSSIRKSPLARSVSVHFQALTGNWNTSLVENWKSVWPHAFAGWCCKSNVINFMPLVICYLIPNLCIDILVFPIEWCQFYQRACPENISVGGGIPAKTWLIVRNFTYLCEKEGGFGASCDMKFATKKCIEAAEISQNFSKFSPIFTKILRFF